MVALQDLPLAAFLAIPLVAGCITHYTVEPASRSWVATLRRSELTPPPAAFPIVWLINYLNLGFASYRIIKAGGGNAQIVAYIAHLLVLNAWNPICLVTRRLGLAFCIMLLLLTTTPVLIWEFSCWDRLAGIVLMPYYLWLALLTHLSHYMWINNPGPQFGFVKDEVIRQHKGKQAKDE